MQAAKWGPNLNLPPSGPFQNSSTALSTASISGDTTTKEQTSSNSEPLQYSSTSAFISEPTSNSTASVPSKPSNLRTIASSSSSFVTAPALNKSVATQPTSSPSGTFSKSSAFKTAPTSNGTAVVQRNSSTAGISQSSSTASVGASNDTVQQRLSTSGTYQNSSLAITPGSPNGTATARPTLTNLAHAITPPPAVFPFPSNVSSNSSLSIPQTCFDLGFAYLHPDWIGNQTVPDNTCFQTTTDSAGVVCPAWSSCTVDVGTVQLIYFPTSSNNVTHPSTLYDPKYNYTFTSPSVYGFWTKMNVWNKCNGVTNAPLGFSLTSVIQAFDITDFRSSLYWGSTTSISDGKVQTLYSWEQLHLSDLYSDCPTSFAAQTTEPAASVAAHSAAFREFSNGHSGYGPVPSQYRCNPQLAIPLIATQEGWPWWRDCKLDNGYNGMPDPPYALNFSKNPFPSDNGQPVSSALPGPAGVPSLNQAPSTAPVQWANPPAATANTGSPQPNKVMSPQPQPQSPDGNGPGASSPLIQDGNPTPGANPPQRQPQGPQGQPPQGQPQLPSQPITAVSVAVIGTDIISALPPNTNNDATTPAAIVLPGGSTLLPGALATLPNNDGSGNSVVVSVPAAGGNSNGNLVISTLGSPTAGTYNVGDVLSKGNLGAGGGGVTTVAGLNNAVPSYGPGGVAVQNQGGGITTLSAGGPAVTMGSQGAVLSYGSAGIVVQYPGGQISTLAAPSPVAPAAGGLVTTVAGLNNAVLNYGASGVVVKVSNGGSTTLSTGGPTMTLGSNTILSYGPFGVVVQYPGGAISTLPLPTPASAFNGLVTTATGLNNAILSYGPFGVVVKGPGGVSTTLSVGGHSMTLGSNTVLSHGPSGVVIQYPGGRVTTIAPSGGIGVGPLVNQIINGTPTTTAGGNSETGEGVSGTPVATGTGSISGASSTAGSGKPTALPSVIVKGGATGRLSGTFLYVLAAFSSLALTSSLL